MRILLIDDEHTYYHLLKEHVDQSGYRSDIELIWVEDPDLIPEGQFDVYLVDNRFRGMEKGLNCINRIYSMHAKGQVWVVSGHADFDFLKKLFREHVNGFIDKNDRDFSQLDEVIKATIEMQEIQYRLIDRLKALQTA